MKKYLALAALAATLSAGNGQNNYLAYDAAKQVSGKGIGSLSRHKAKMKCKKYC